MKNMKYQLLIIILKKLIYYIGQISRHPSWDFCVFLGDWDNLFKNFLLKKINFKGDQDNLVQIFFYHKYKYNNGINYLRSPIMKL